jgi:hypothetical protein
MDLRRTDKSQTSKLKCNLGENYPNQKYFDAWLLVVKIDADSGKICERHNSNVEKEVVVQGRVCMQV